jgi:hypothetical protein
MQFQQDWPGLFIRGDDAIAVLSELRQLERLLQEQCKASLPWKLSTMADIIVRDVIVRGS